MKKTVYIAETYDGDTLISEISFNDLMNNTTLHLMPGSFRKIELSKKQINKLRASDADGCPLYYLKNNRVYYI